MPKFKVMDIYDVVKDVAKIAKDGQTNNAVFLKDGRKTIFSESRVMKSLEKGLSTLDRDAKVYPYWNIESDEGKVFIVTPIDDVANFVYNEDWCITVVYLENKRPVFSVIYSVLDETLYYAIIGHVAYRLNRTPTKLVMPKPLTSYCLCVDEPVIADGYKLLDGILGVDHAVKIYSGKSFNEAIFKLLDGSCGVIVYREAIRERNKFLAAFYLLSEIGLNYRVLNKMVYYSNAKVIEKEAAKVERIERF